MASPLIGHQRCPDRAISYRVFRAHAIIQTSDCNLTPPCRRERVVVCFVPAPVVVLAMVLVSDVVIHRNDALAPTKENEPENRDPCQGHQADA
mmetsp:Transcript_30635/g.53766  ORF Transcript_30635/g.53766 Transcript_30635/m.53766 type:complete len:93 (+) Transcript_30635:247-525(+)